MYQLTEKQRERLGVELCALLDNPDYPEAKKADIMAFFHAGQPVSTILEDVGQ